MAKELKDIAYGEGLDGQLIDVYVPDGEGPWPLVIRSRGSGWPADTGRGRRGDGRAHRRRHPSSRGRLPAERPAERGRADAPRHAPGVHPPHSLHFVRPGDPTPGGPYGHDDPESADSKAGADVELITLPHTGHGPWNDFLTDRRVTREAFRLSSREGTESAARRCDPTWDTVVDFFHRHL